MTNETKREFGVGRWIMRNGNPAVVAGIVPKPRVTHYSLVGWFWNGNEWEHERLNDAAEARNDLFERVAAIETAVEKVQQADDRMKNRLDDIVQGLSQSVRCLARKLAD